MKEKFIDSNAKLFFWFLIFPVIITLIIVYFFKNMLKIEFITYFMSVSGYLFSLTSLILVFILFKTFRFSDYTRAVTDKNYLEKNAKIELIESLTDIQKSLYDNSVPNIIKSYLNIQYIYNSLKNYKEDVILKAYFPELKSIFNILNKYKFYTISIDKDITKWTEIPNDIKSDLYLKVDNLSTSLKHSIEEEELSNEC